MAKRNKIHLCTITFLVERKKKGVKNQWIEDYEFDEKYTVLLTSNQQLVYENFFLKRIKKIHNIAERKRVSIKRIKREDFIGYPLHNDGIEK